MKKKNNMFMIAALGPAILCFLLAFAYPLVRAVMMSLYHLPSISSKMAEWDFVGLGNYKDLFGNSVFLSSLKNIALIWSIGGIFTLGIALFFAVILASGVKGKKFWRSAIYLPNTVSAVALSTMWLQYVFQNKFGLFKKMFTMLGIDALASINWTSPKYLFWAMLLSYVYGSVGYFMLIFLSGIEQIPKDLYESAKLDGAGVVRQFCSITVPLLRNVLRNGIILWTTGSVNFFAWAKMFSPKIKTTTVTPVYLLYSKVFGSADGGTVLDVGGGAAIGVIVAILVLCTYIIMNKVFKEEDLEY